MYIDPNSKIVKLCLQALEQENEREEALKLCETAWALAETAAEKVTAAHYLAQHQVNIEDKLKWDETALLQAEQLIPSEAGPLMPSLLLNAAKGYEDLGNKTKAKTFYERALSFTDQLTDDGYKKFVMNGIIQGLQRVKRID